MARIIFLSLLFVLRDGYACESYLSEKIFFQINSKISLNFKFISELYLYFVSEKKNRCSTFKNNRV